MHDRRTLSAVRSDEIGRGRFGAWVSMSRLPRYMNLPSMPPPLSESCFLGPMCALLVKRRSVFLVMYCHSEGSSGSVLALPTFPTQKDGFGPGNWDQKSCHNKKAHPTHA